MAFFLVVDFESDPCRRDFTADRVLIIWSMLELEQPREPEGPLCTLA
jgi:hypothetical protein